MKNRLELLGYAQCLSCYQHLRKLTVTGQVKNDKGEAIPLQLSKSKDPGQVYRQMRNGSFKIRRLMPTLLGNQCYRRRQQPGAESGGTSTMLSIS